MKENRMSDVKDKLRRELAEAKKAGKYASAVMDSLVKALEVFAGKDPEFADAILDGSLLECAKSIERGFRASGRFLILRSIVWRCGISFPGLTWSSLWWFASIPMGARSWIGSLRLTRGSVCWI